MPTVHLGCSSSSCSSLDRSPLKTRNIKLFLRSCSNCFTSKNMRFFFLLSFWVLHFFLEEWIRLSAIVVLPFRKYSSDELLQYTFLSITRFTALVFFIIVQPLLIVFQLRRCHNHIHKSVSKVVLWRTFNIRKRQPVIKHQHFGQSSIGLELNLTSWTRLRLFCMKCKDLPALLYPNCVTTNIPGVSVYNETKGHIEFVFSITTKNMSTWKPRRRVYTTPHWIGSNLPHLFPTMNLQSRPNGLSRY